MSELILEMRDIVKEFPGVKALDGVSFSDTATHLFCKSS